MTRTTAKNEREYLKVRLIVLCFSSLLKGTDCKEPQINPGRTPRDLRPYCTGPLGGQQRNRRCSAKLRRKKVSYSFKGIVKGREKQTFAPRSPEVTERTHLSFAFSVTPWLRGAKVLPYPMNMLYDS